MNEELLRDAHPHVQDEWVRMTDLIGVQASAVRLATEAFVALHRGRTLDLPGKPPKLDAPYMEWEDYFISQGTLRLLQAQAEASNPTLFVAA